MLQTVLANPGADVPVGANPVGTDAGIEDVQLLLVESHNLVTAGDLLLPGIPGGIGDLHQLNADLLEVLGHQRASLGGIALLVAFQIDENGLAIVGTAHEGPVTIRVAVLGDHVNAIQQSVGGSGIILSPLIPGALDVLGSALGGSGLGRLRHTGVQDLIELIAVHRDGQGVTEVDVREELRVLLVLVGLVQLDGAHRPVGLQAARHSVVTHRLAGLVGGEVADGNAGHIQVLGDHLLGIQCGVHGDHFHSVDVGELTTLGIGLPEVGIALEHIGLVALFGSHDPGTEGRTVRVAPVHVAQLIAQLHIVRKGEPGIAGGCIGNGFRLGHGSQILAAQNLRIQSCPVRNGGIISNDILVPVLGGKHPLVVDGDIAQDQGLGAVKLDLEGVVIHYGDDGGLGYAVGRIHGSIPVVGGATVAGGNLAGLGIHVGDQHVVVIEGNVVGGEGLAVGPLHAFAQIDGVNKAVVTDIIALGNVGSDTAVLGQPEQGFLREGAEVPLAAVVPAQGAAELGILRSLVGLHHDVRRHRQTLTELGNLPRFDHFGQHGGFFDNFRFRSSFLDRFTALWLIGGGRFRRGPTGASCQHGQEHNQCQDQRHGFLQLHSSFLHSFFGLSNICLGFSRRQLLTAGADQVVLLYASAKVFSQCSSMPARQAVALRVSSAVSSGIRSARLTVSPGSTERSDRNTGA